MLKSSRIDKPTAREKQLEDAIRLALEQLTIKSFTVGPDLAEISDPIEESSIAETLITNAQKLPAADAQLLRGDCACIRAAVFELAKGLRDANHPPAEQPLQRRSAASSGRSGQGRIRPESDRLLRS